MIYELKVYRAVPGKLPALMQRFEATALKFWEKHGIRPVGFFTTVVGESTYDLTHILAWESLAEREKKWDAFIADADWQAARAKSEENGPLVANVSSQLLAPTAFSALK